MRRLLDLSTIIAAMTATPALAQDAAGRDDETIVVTASLDGYAPEPALGTRTGTPSLLVPFSSDAVGEALIEDRGLLSLSDALRTISGTAPVTGIGGFNTRFRLRGFVSTNALRNGFRQAVGFPVTEVANIDRIEVLKGPASSLYGRFEPGGVVNIVTKGPLERDRFETAAFADEDGLLRGAVDLNLAASDALAVRLNAAYDNGESFRDFVENETVLVAPAASLRLGPDTTLLVEGEYLDRDGVFDRGFVTNRLLLNLPPSRFLGDPADVYANETAVATATLDHRFSDAWRLRVGGSWSRGASDGAYFFPQAAGGAPLVSTAGVLNRRFQTTRDVQEDRTFQTELVGRFAAGAVDHTLLLVADYNEDEGTSVIRRATVNAPISIFNPVYGTARPNPTAGIVDTVATNRSLGATAQIETGWTDWLRTTAAVRIERLRSRFRDLLTGMSGRANETAATPRAGITLLPTPTVAIFANYGRSFAPEVSTRPIVGGGQPEPSEGEQVEAGVRWAQPGGRIRASAAVFEIAKSNIRVAEPGGSPFDRQVGEQRSRGIELDLAAQPAPELRLELAYAHIDAEVSRDRVLRGRELQATPRHSASLWARWDPTPTFGIGAGAFLIGDRFVDTQNSFALDGYERIDAALYWRPFERVEVQLNLLNAFDVRYFENGNTNNNFYPGQPRTLRGSVRVVL
jgi:iron complex outermembrane recepter protein